MGRLVIFISFLLDNICGYWITQKLSELSKNIFIEIQSFVVHLRVIIFKCSLSEDFGTYRPPNTDRNSSNIVLLL